MADPEKFQSTHPVRGATTTSKPTFTLKVKFQSTHPVRGATKPDGDVQFYLLISIHAPREGCDQRDRGQRALCQNISIHAPREGCDTLLCERHRVPRISIHAPREGCDLAKLSRCRLR